MNASYPAFKMGCGPAFLLLFCGLACAQNAARPDAVRWQQLTDQLSMLAGSNKLTEVIAPAQ
jgi:uncharacterized protein (DUF2236 family)